MNRKQSINSQIMAKSMLIWLGIIPLAILNGTLREYIITPLLNEIALPVSGILLCLMIFIMAYIFIPRVGKANQSTYIKIGLLWFSSTILFEFLFGLANNVSFSDMLKAYNPFTGNLWLIVILVTGVAPWLSAKCNQLI